MTQSLATRGRAALNPALSMATAGVVDASPLASLLAPLITNIVPAANSEQAGLLRPISLTIRDRETYVDLAQLAVKVGYATIHSNATELFDLLPNTSRVSLFEGAETDGLIDVIDEGILIAKNSTDPQKTVYATKVDVGGNGYPSFMISAFLRRDVVSVGPLNASVYPGLNMPVGFNPGAGGGLSEEDEPFTGTVIGIEHGPRGRAAYLWLQEDAVGHRYIRLTSYLRDDNSPTVNLFAPFEWGSDRRFTVLWNEVEGVVEVYATGAETLLLFKVPIISFPVMPDDYYRHSGAGDVVALYGQEGDPAGRSVWSNIAITTDVGYPVLGSIRMSNFVTQILGPEFWRVRGSEDPRTLGVGPWFAQDPDLFSSADASGYANVSGSLFRMTKQTLGSTYCLFRREPGLASSDTDGFMIQADIEAVGMTKQESCSGMGIVVFDGQTAFQILMFEDDSGIKRLGLLRTGGDEFNINDHIIVEFDWSTGPFRFVMDPRGNFLRFFSLEDLGTAILDISFNRGDLPTAAEKGWSGEIPFIAMGHITNTNTTGVFVLRDLVCNHFYQGWAAVDTSPGASDPSFSTSTTGSPSLVTANGVTTISCDPGELAKYHRQASFSSLRGAVVEARMRITSHRARTRTGTYLLLDDGSRCFALTFVDSYTGKYAAVSLRNGSGGFQELVGRDGEGALYSFPCDWTQFHTYRMERQIYGGLSIYLDDEVGPRISFPHSKLALLPNPQYGGTPTLAFGQFTTEGGTSEWSFINAFFSRGYEVSMKKNKSDAVLRRELFNTQAIVLATAVDV